MNSEDEFLKAWSMIKETPAQIIEYRIHYNDQGDITMCSMVDHPDSEQYIIVNKKEYDEYYKYNVVKNKLKLIDHNPGYYVQLKKSDSGYKVVKNHSGLLIEPVESFDDIEYYASTN